MWTRYSVKRKVIYWDSRCPAGGITESGVRSVPWQGWRWEQGEQSSSIMERTFWHYRWER